MSDENLSEEILTERAQEVINIAEIQAHKHLGLPPHDNLYISQFDFTLSPPLNYALYQASKLTLLPPDNYQQVQGSLFQQMLSMLPNNERFRLDCRYLSLLLLDVLKLTPGLQSFDIDNLELKKISLKPYYNYHTYIDLPQCFQPSFSLVGLNQSLLIYSPNGHINTTIERLRNLHPGLKDDELYTICIPEGTSYHYGIDFVPNLKDNRTYVNYYPRLMLIVGDNSGDNLGLDLKSQVMKLESIYLASLP
jgi:hypothetical protein